jgi:hypothetical protein
VYSSSTSAKVTPLVKGLRNGSPFFWSFLKGLYGGLHFTLALLLLCY